MDERAHSEDTKGWSATLRRWRRLPLRSYGQPPYDTCSEVQLEADGHRSLPGKIVVEVERVELIILIRDVEEADLYLGCAVKEAIACVEVELPEIRVGKTGVAVVLSSPQSLKLAKEAARVIIIRVKGDLLQSRVYVLIDGTAQTRLVDEPGLKVRASDLITNADGSLIADELIETDDDGLFGVIEILAGLAGTVRSGERSAVSDDAEGAKALGFQHLRSDAEISVGFEGLIQAKPVSGEASSGRGASKGFGKDATESLIEPGDLRGLETNAGKGELASE